MSSRDEPVSGDRYIGLISGTSVDAMDAVLVDFTPSGPGLCVLATYSAPPPPGLRDALLAANAGDHRLSFVEYGRLDQAVARWASAAAHAVCDRADVSLESVDAIGSHGQTVWHAPDDTLGFSLQIGHGARIAADTGTIVVSDFRSMDLALGGQGAPLVCACHGALFGLPDQARAVVNIGGIANITLLPAGADTDVMRISGFDTGPGNGLMDEWIHRHRGLSYDADGDWAAAGRIDDTLLQQLLTDAYFARAAPKSTGRDLFGLAWLEQHLAALDHRIAAVDVQATLAELTARTIADGLRTMTPVSDTVYLCGGGAHNRHLMQRLAVHVAPARVATTDDLGVEGDWVEAIAFAWLARERLANRPGNAPRVTGASRPGLLGAIHA
ncbi:anhydro-N-acetylmuramic acid kinase [Salinisphaera japonica]|uniref:Anhydro-N-acetylmuramic acid kinase n=1 Tax=Salinisphaera japonica YTM-1 TaxID=1209778 RepID=A0A423PHU6_9GAMM|nr:anhydro-N-acetylmuramic acid kinase [Salinisphaera japonica]ROO25167.1 anhydro-N-acetylmuramic acid kinase [Salinisphaera japonica YTM-1]